MTLLWCWFPSHRPAAPAVYWSVSSAESTAIGVKCWTLAPSCQCHPHILGGKSPDATDAVFFLNNTQTLHIGTRRLPNRLRAPRISARVKNIAQSPNAGRRPAWFFLPAEGHEGFSSAAVLLDYARLERHRGKSGKKRHHQIRGYKNQICISPSFEILHYEQRELLNLDDVRHMKQENGKQCRFFENHLCKHSEN